MKRQDKVYWLTVEDIQEVARDTLDRELTAKEVERVADGMGNYLNWYDAVSFAITDAGITEEAETPAKKKQSRETAKA